MRDLTNLITLYNWEMESNGHKEFHFGLFNNDQNRCGTMGCILGDAPLLWPDEWIFTNDDGVMLKGENEESAFKEQLSACKFFQLDWQEVNHLFFPYKQDTFLYGGKNLIESSPKQEVLENMRIFIEQNNK